MKRYTFADYILILVVMVIGLAEAAHFGAVFFGWSISRCSVLFAVGVAVLVAVGVAFLIYSSRKSEKDPCPLQRHPSKGQGEQEPSRVKKVLPYVCFVLLVVSQIIFICIGGEIFRNGDMTVETVGSFLVHDGVYKVNPLTGNPYTAGIPLRLEILGLPTLYSMICYLTGAEPAVLVYCVVPVCVLLLSYLAFATLGKVIFAENSNKVIAFLVVVAALMWIGAYMYGMDGFNLLCCGWRGVTIRNLVLMPWLLSLCIRKKYFGVLLCFVAEICLVWTLYGLGACLVVAIGMLLAGKERKV